MKNILYLTCLLVAITLQGQQTITDTDISNQNAGEGDLYKHSNGKIYIGLNSGIYHPLSTDSSSSNIYNTDGTINTNRYISGTTTNYIWFDKFAQFYIDTSDYLRITSQNNIELQATNTIKIKGTNGILLQSNTDVSGDIKVTGSYTDSNNTTGTSGQVLSTTATGTKWVTSSTSISTDSNNSLQTGTDNGIYYSSPIKSFGKVQANGQAVKILNATVHKISKGQYQITFTNPMSDADYIIQLAQPSRNGVGYDDPGIAYYEQETTGFQVRIGDNDNSTTDRNKFDSEFMFTILDYTTPSTGTIPGIIGTLTNSIVVDDFSDGQYGTANNFRFLIRNNTGNSINYQALIKNVPYSYINGQTLKDYTYQVFNNGDGTYNHLFTSTKKLKAWKSKDITGANNIQPPGIGNGCNCITFYEF